MGEITIECASQTLVTQDTLLDRRRAVDREVIQLSTIGTNHRIYVVGRLHASLKLDGVQACLREAS